MNYNIGQYINELILDSGLSQAEVSLEINISRQLLSYVICGKRERCLYS